MTTRQLTALGRCYMKRLGMHDWLGAATFKVQKLDGLCGRSEWHAEERKCWIAVAPAEEAVMQETLIHELLHVCLEGHLPLIEGAPADYDANYELGLNRIAKALWNEWSE